jgi:tetratricopeptide (TPR) repeat protein
MCLCIMRHVVTLLSATLCAMTVFALPAQSVAAHVAAGDSAYAALRLPDALRHYLAALAVDSSSGDALWRAARTESELAEYDSAPGEAASLREKAERHARAAVSKVPKNAQAHFALAVALGRMALTIPTFDRLPFATEIHHEVGVCLALAPKHAGCLHVVALWAAEYMRLGTFTRDMANTMTGGKLFATITWEDAERDLLAAIELEPQRAIHHLDLARILADQGKTDSARVELQATLDAPIRDYNDPHYRAEAVASIALLVSR